MNMKQKCKSLLPLSFCLLSASLSAQGTPESACASGERTLSADSLVAADTRLDSIYQSLPEIMITGQRPIVKAEQGKLVYDLPRLIGSRHVDNAYDAVKELPGVTEMEGRLMLAGQSVTVVLDGKVTTLTTEQLYALLKSIPAGRIANAEVMYSAPARYQVRGALINLTLKPNTDAPSSLQGEAYGKYRQKHYEGFSERVSLIYNRKKFSADFLYSHTHGRGYTLTDKDALHAQTDGSTHHITTDEAGRSLSHTHSFRAGADYNWSQAHQLSLVYNGNYSTYHSLMDIFGTQRSDTRSRSRDWLHNARLDYRTPFGLKAGAEMTYYRSPSSQQLHSILQGEELAFRTEDCQRINRWKFFLAQEHDLGRGWEMNYGAVYTTSIDHSYQFYYDTRTAAMRRTAIPAAMQSRRREQTLNLYAGFSKSFGDKLSLDASLAAEHYRTPAWNQWDVYPTLNLSYTPAPGQVWQLALSSDKAYPDYWAVQDAVSYLGGGYSEVRGNPSLKPAQEYQLQLTHILKGRYIFSAWFSYIKDYSTQTLYQSQERLVEIYKYLNFNFQQQAGVQASVPFGIKHWLDSRLTLVGVWHREKDDDFWDLPFDRSICYGIAMLTNSITLSKKPDLKLTLTGMVRSKATQGIYDLPASGYVNAALRYGFARGKAVLTLYCDDIFETGQISPRIRFATQHVTNSYGCFREAGVSVAYKFGGYKEKKRAGVDTSRFK